MLTIGITGAGGFIGGALVPYLARRGHRLILVDNFTGPIRVQHPEHPVAAGDLTRPGTIEAMKGADVVLHLAAVSGVMACANDPVGSRVVNLGATRSLALWCRANHVPLAFASSFAVVGIPDRLPITEATPAKPTHEYARQKAEGERIVAEAAGTGGVRVGIVRMSNVYGRYPSGGTVVAKGNVLNAFVQQAREDGVLNVNAPGTQRRDYIHLYDVLAHWEATAQHLADHRDRAEPVVFNAASGEGASVLELAHLLSARWARTRGGPPLEIRTVPNPRGSIELLAPEFSIDRTATERELRVHCTRHLEDSIDGLLADRVDPVP